MRHTPALLARALTALAMTAALPALALEAHQAEGWFSVDGERVEVSSAYGWQEPHLFDRDKMETIVVLATVPFDHTVLDRYLSFGFEPDRMLRSGGGEGLKLTIDPDGRIVGAMPTRIENAAGGARGGPATLEPVAGGLRGRARSDQPMPVTDLGEDPRAGKSTERAVAFDVGFHITLVERRARGPALPDGGGEPGAAYLAMHEARLAGDDAAMLGMMERHRAASMAEQLADPELAPLLARMRASGPQTARVVSGRADGDDAWLVVAGEMAGGKGFEGEVRMQREGGAWRIAEERLKAAN
jgi:hypothetical protein